MTAPSFVDGIGAFADCFDGFILDQWGVLHDGSKPLPGVLPTLERLHRMGKRIALLSNSARRAELNIRRLAKMGFDLGQFVGVISSGETSWRLLGERSGAPWNRLGRLCLFTTLHGDTGPVEGLGLDLVDDPDDAEFLLITGLEEREAETFRPMLERAAARNLPMVCANPDKWAPQADGLTPSPGLLAQMYEGMGGTVHYVGKPYPPVYRECLRTLGDLPLERIVAVGDSLEHDIAGAKGMGLTACMLLEGIHGDRFPRGMDRAAEVGTLAELIAHHGVTPDLVARRFNW